MFELTLAHPNQYAEPFYDVTVDVTFHRPPASKSPIGGFHYGSLQPPAIKCRPRPARAVPVQVRGPALWKARFAPWELGTWQYSYVFANADGRQATGTG